MTVEMMIKDATYEAKVEGKAEGLAEGASKEKHDTALRIVNL